MLIISSTRKKMNILAFYSATTTAHASVDVNSNFSGGYVLYIVLNTSVRNIVTSNN